MTELEYITTKFRQNFSSYKNSNIVLYGLGTHTKVLLDEFRDFRFLALMDGYKVDGEAYGKPIIPIDKLKELNINIVIIVARPASVKIIYKRISDYCKENNIRVLDMNGYELSKEEKNKDKNFDCFDLCKEDLRKAIREHDVISFDIFDTLLVRNVLYPQDVFQIVQNRNDSCNFDFVKERTLAERKLAEICPTLEDIYTEISNSTGIGKQETDRLQRLELMVEEEILTCRQAMKELIDYAVTLKKKVYLISDMYLSKSLIADILTRRDITGYEAIFVSCDYHTGKKQALFQEFKKHVKSDSYLHIGDDEQADGIFAKLNGMDFILIEKSSALLEKSSYGSSMNQSDLHENHIALGLIAANVFNDPFSLYHTDGRPVIHSPYQFGYICIAPVLSNFVLWMLESLRGKDFGHILFLARDGYLIKLLYDEAVRIMEYEDTLPESIYFLTSRSAGISATANTDTNLLYAAKLPFDGTPEELLRKRFFLQVEEINAYESEKYDSIEEYVLHHKMKIKWKANELKDNYQHYMDTLLLNPKKKLALFDFVSTGTCQMCLEELMEQKLEGYNFIHLLDSYRKKELLTVHSYYNKSLLYDQNNCVAENYFFLESVIKAAEPSISHFDINGKPVYLKECKSKDQQDCLKEIQEGVIDYFKNYLNLVKSNQIHTIREDAEAIFSLMQGKYSLVKNLVGKDFFIRDEFCNREIDINSYLDIY